MSSCTVSGFFDICPHRRGLQGLRVADPLARLNLFGHYRSSVTGTMQSLRIVHIRPPTAAWNDILAERAVVYVRGTFFAQMGSHPSLLDADHMDVILTSQTRHRFTVQFPPSHVDAVSTIAGEQYYYSPTFLALPVTVSHDVWDGTRTFNLVCLIPHDNLETEYPRLPCIGSFVQLRGYFSRVLASGIFAVEVDDLNYTCPFGSVPSQSSDASD